MNAAPKPGVLDIDAYVPGRSEAKGTGPVYKLSSNESPFGPSPKAVAAYEAAEGALGVYPEGTSRILRDALAAHYAIPADCIVCGNGSDEILHLVANCYLRPGDEVLFSAHGFSLYKIATLANSAVPVEIPEPSLRTDVDAVIARLSPRTRLVFLANPNNPTGSYLTADELKRLQKALPERAFLILDSAYAEYVGRPDYDAGVDLVRASDNVVMTRTFSKAYGLAGIRIGWAYAPKAVADVLNRVRAPFNVNIAAQRAAVAALADQAFTQQAIAHNAAERTRLIADIRALGIRADDSWANFVLLHFPEQPGKSAADADIFLMARGVILRGCTSYGLPQCLRLTVGGKEANGAALAALRAFAERAR